MSGCSDFCALASFIAPSSVSSSAPAALIAASAGAKCAMIWRSSAGSVWNAPYALAKNSSGPSQGWPSVIAPPLHSPSVTITMPAGRTSSSASALSDGFWRLNGLVGSGTAAVFESRRNRSESRSASVSGARTSGLAGSGWLWLSKTACDASCAAVSTAALAKSVSAIVMSALPSAKCSRLASLTTKTCSTRHGEPAAIAPFARATAFATARSCLAIRSRFANGRFPHARYWSSVMVAVPNWLLGSIGASIPRSA